MLFVVRIRNCQANKMPQSLKRLKIFVFSGRMDIGSYLFLTICIIYCIAMTSAAEYRCCAPPPVSRRPSRAPTIRPTRFPSPSPTRRPSRSPTPIPTKLPSTIPTRRPSRSPTFAPSEIPTEEPTYMPSQPTSQPTSTPTTFTPRPSLRPSIAPSALPTDAPSMEPTSSPTIAPTRKPSGQPTESPTISYRPTAFPTLNPTPMPSTVPSTAPSPSPSLQPTAKPTVSPTFAPTTAIATVVSLSVSQTLVNIDAASFLSSSSNSDAFKLAVADSIEGIQEADVTIESVADSAGAAIRSAQAGHQRHLRRSTAISSSKQMFIIMAVPEITIEYLIAFVMEELGYDNTTLAVHQTSARLSGAVEDGTFLENLRAAVLLLGADAALLNVTSNSVALISSSTAVLRSAAPSVQPTALAFSTSAEDAAAFKNWNPGVQAIVIIIVVIVFLVLLVVISQFMQRYSWFATLYGRIEVMVFGWVGSSLHSAYLQKQEGGGDAPTSNSSPMGDDAEASAQQQLGESSATNNVINPSLAPSVASPFAWAEMSSQSVKRMEGLDAEALGVLELEEVLEEKPEFHPLLFLSRHSEATETLMRDLEAAIYNSMPWLQHEMDNDSHPLVDGIAPEYLPTARPPTVARAQHPLSSSITPLQHPLNSVPVPAQGPALHPGAATEVGPMDGHSREYAGSATDNADDDLSFYDCNPSVSIPLPFGVPLISRHSSATHNVIAGIEELLSRAGLSLIEDQEEKEGEYAPPIPGRSPANSSFVRGGVAQQKPPVLFEYTDMLSALIASHNSQEEIVEPPLPPTVEDEEQKEVLQEREQEIIPQDDHQESSASTDQQDATAVNSRGGTRAETFHYVDALSALIANSNLEQARATEFFAGANQGGFTEVEVSAPPSPPSLGAQGSESPFVSLSAVPRSHARNSHDKGKLPVEPVDISTASRFLTLAVDSPSKDTATAIPAPSVSALSPALSPRSAHADDDSSVLRHRLSSSSSHSILSGESYFSVASGVTADTGEGGAGGGRVNSATGIISRLEGAFAYAAANNPDGGNNHGDVDEEMILRKVRSGRRKAGVRSPRESSASFTKPKSPRNDLE